MVLLSGGIDSPVACYLMMKRGVHIECIHYASPPYTSKNAQEKVMELARLVSGYQGDVLVHVVPFTDLQYVHHASSLSSRQLENQFRHSIKPWPFHQHQLDILQHLEYDLS